MVEWWDKEFSQKLVKICKVLLITLPFMPCWVHSKYYAVWFPLFGIYIGGPINGFISVNLCFYVFALISLFGGVLCFFEKKNSNLLIIGTLIAIISTINFLFFFVYNTVDLSYIQTIINSKIGISTYFENFYQFLNSLYLKIVIEATLFFHLLQGNILSADYATKFNFQFIPILLGILILILRNHNKNSTSS